MRGHLGDPALVAYRAQTVRVGVIATYLVLIPVAAYALLAPAGTVAHVPYWSAVAAGLVATTAIGLLPWQRVLATWRGLALMHAWSVGDIALIGVIVAASGGAESPLWAVYMLTTVFFAASYPLAGQVVLFGLTTLIYLAACAVSPEPLAPSAPNLVWRLGIMAVVAYMASHLSRSLTREMVAHANERERSQRRTARMAAVADAAKRIHTLDPDAVFQEVVGAMSTLGYPVSGVVLTEPSGDGYRIVAGHGLPDFLSDPAATHAGRPVLGPPEVHGMEIITEQGAEDRIARVLRERGLDEIATVPIHRGSRPMGLLACARASDGTPHDLETLQTLAALAGRALENAHLFRLKTDFTANTSHELRTPLTVLRGLSETFQQHHARLDDEVRGRLASQMVEASLRLERLILALLDFAALESGKRRSEPASIDLVASLEAAIDACRETLVPRDVTLQVGALPRVHADPVLLEMVLTNLLSNVAVHTPAQTAVAVRALELPSGRVEVSVSDDGPGIPSDDVDRITERFFRGGDHLTRDRPGLGLGLALVSEILSLHETELSVQSAPGLGSTFSFSLPVAPHPLRVEAGAVAPPDSGGSPVPGPVAAAGAEESV